MNFSQTRPQSGSRARVLAGGRHLIRFGPTWNLEHHGQMIDRLYRMGQEKPVIIHTIVAQDTIDETIVSALAGKAKITEL